MSDNKKYYYIKLKENFFDRTEIKILEKEPNGLVYCNLYMKLCLLSLKGNGRLLFMDEIPYNEEMISTATGLELDNVRAGLHLLETKFKMIKRMDCGEIWITDIQGMVGHSSTEGERKAEYRNRLKLRDNVPLLSGHSSTRVKRLENRDKSKEIKKEKKCNKFQVSQFVKLSLSDYRSLLKEYGSKQELRWAIKRLDVYIDTSYKGKKYTNHKAVLRDGNWVYREWQKERNNKQPSQPVNKPKKYTTVEELERERQNG